jgi:hypothetical protein
MGTRGIDGHWTYPACPNGRRPALERFALRRNPPQGPTVTRPSVDFFGPRRRRSAHGLTAGRSDTTCPRVRRAERHTRPLTFEEDRIGNGRLMARLGDLTRRTAHTCQLSCLSVNIAQCRRARLEYHDPRPTEQLQPSCDGSRPAAGYRRTLARSDGDVHRVAERGRYRQRRSRSRRLG